ncbi:gonadal somatic cell derived factor [Anabas testudineus]|uniref:TGF-beta family profile domain-containing protein n=2 Tax=Anabas testudineus TaxID=64144 RepID=A0A3Q1IPN0_ANATE|nr:gonadal somatic cell derived factor [Anabas testudineus]
MTFAFTVVMLLLGSSLVIAFVLQPAKEQRTPSASSLVSHPRCHGESLQSIRKSLLRALNLQAEPQLPVGGLDSVREQWKSIFSTISHRAEDAAAVPGYSVSPADGNSTSLKCCSMASEIFIRDLGWDTWVIHPASLTMVQCAICNPEVNTVQCPPHLNNMQDSDSQVQVPCCEPTSHEMVPIVYVDEFSTLVISSVQLARSCGCGPGNIQQLSEKE